MDDRAQTGTREPAAAPEPTATRELDKAYRPADFEPGIYERWRAADVFAPDGAGSRADPARQPFVIIQPPPNVTGSLHLGHAQRSTVEDLMIRHARMTGRPRSPASISIALEGRRSRIIAAEGEAGPASPGPRVRRWTREAIIGQQRGRRVIDRRRFVTRSSPASRGFPGATPTGGPPPIGPGRSSTVPWLPRMSMRWYHAGTGLPGHPLLTDEATGPPTPARPYPVDDPSETMLGAGRPVRTTPAMRPSSDTRLLPAPSATSRRR
jgi:hypothetical protein